MSEISLKSITGITSITTPTGVDNQLTVHNNNTTEAVKFDNAGNVHINNQLEVAGVSTFSGGIGSTITVAAGVGSTAITLDNSHQIAFGSANELAMFHDGTNSYIKQRYFSYPSRLKIISENSSIDIMSGSGGGLHGGYENAIQCENNGAVKLYWAGFGPHLETTNGGIIVQGNITLGDSIIHNGDANTKIRFPEADAVTIETNGSERFRINSSGAWGIGAAYGSSGQVLTSGGSGSSPSWTTITGTTINNNANNRLITGSGTANTLEGEANLTFDGDNLLIKSSTDGRRIRFAGDGTSHYMKYDNTLGGIILSGYGGIAFETYGTNERIRIASNGGVGIATDKIPRNYFLHIAAPSQDFTNSSTQLMDGGGICLQTTDTLPSTGRNYPGIFWSGNTSALGRARAGIIGVTASNNDATHIAFLTRTAADGTSFYPSDERMRISAAGDVGIGYDSPPCK